MTAVSSLTVILLWALCSLSLAAGTTHLQVREILIIAGNFSLNGKFTNLAQYDINSGIWSDSSEPDLYVYGESNGVLWDTKVNRSSRPGPGGAPVDELVVVGAFDTVAKTSQMLYCSVGIWTGLSFDKVGEGLCPRGGGSSSGMLIQTSVVGSDGDLFVGGFFSSRVWDGARFTDVHDMAHFQGASSSWLPLSGGRLQCKQAGKCTARVSALAWDADSRTLFIGGKFNFLSEAPITSGLCMWSQDTGVVSFSSDAGAGLSLSSPSAEDGEATALTYDSRSQSLFVAGSYSFVAGMQCSSIAVWHRPSDTWTCLDTPDYSISTVTAMCLDGSLGALYLAGWASFQAKWRGRDWGSPYAISRISVGGYRQHHADRGGDRQEHVEYVKFAQEGGGRRLGGGRLGRTRGRVPRLPSRPRPALRARGLLADSNHSSLRRSDVILHSNRVVRSTLLASKGSPSAIHHGASNNSTRGLRGQDYHLEWDWLPGFSGGNGPIFNINLGRGKFKDCLFISGAFNNGPPIVLWTPEGVARDKSDVLRNITAGGGGGLDGGDVACAGEPCVFSVGSAAHIYGLVTSVVQMRIPVESVVVDGPDGPAGPGLDDGASPTLYMISVFSITIGLCLGIAITVKCMKNAYSTVPSADMDYSDDDDALPLPSTPHARQSQSVSLGTLSTGGNRTIDLKACYARAMRARHLTTEEVFLTINPQEIELITTIGEGSFGTVWTGVWRNNSVAVKEFCFAQAAIHGDSQQSESLVEEIIGEAGLMTCLRHPKILQLYGCSITPQAVWIVCELCDRGSLRMLLDQGATTLTNEHKLSLCMDVADGMQYLHARKKPIIHRDLKSYNIFISENSPGKFTAKIGDWGSARAVALSGSGSPRSMTQGVGTACWLAPEAIKHAHFSKASDVYSFGIVLWEIYTRRRVHPKLSDSQIIARVASDGLRPEVPVYCSWGELMQRCWEERPSSRPSFTRIVDELLLIYTQERTENAALRSAMNHGDLLLPHDDDHWGLQNRQRNFFHASLSSDDSRDIGDSF